MKQLERQNASRWPTMLIGLCLALAACKGEPVAPGDGAPQLLVLIVIDQVRGDQLDRYGELLTGGLAWLRREGVVFRDAHHGHARTTTGPGHATLSTGCHPSRHGIIHNYWIDRKTGREVYSVEVGPIEGTPTRLLCSTLGDWLKEVYPEAKVFAASGKDRSAVLLGGWGADAAFWYDDKGGFQSSAYYFREEPPWVTGFRAEDLLGQKYFGAEWSARPMSEAELERFGIKEHELWPLDGRFPYVFGGAEIAPDESFYEAVFRSPWSDELLAKFAGALIAAEGLGADAVPDLLALGFSALDAIGHRYGPDSREYLEALVALDRTLADLFAQVDRLVGLDNVLIALTSDHGAVPVPELGAAPGEASRIGNDELLCVQRTERKLDERFGQARWLRGPFLDTETLKARGLGRPEVEGAVVEILEECPSVAKVWSRGELLAPGQSSSPDRELYRRSFHSERSPDFLIQWNESFLTSRSAASSHGSPYAYDTWVPLMIRGPGLAPRVVEERVEAVDLAPTLAALAGLPYPGAIDGAPISLGR